jgi:hypothetical protein
MIDPKPTPQQTSPQYRPAYKVVLSGLSMNSAGNGINRRTVMHAVLTESFERGRLKRKRGELLCGNNRGSFDIAHPLTDDTPVTCPKCLDAISKVKKAQCMTQESPMNQQVDITLKLSLWLDATMDEDDIITHIRSSLPKAFGKELTAMKNPVDILDIQQEAEIYGEEQPKDSRERLLAALTTCANLLADYDEDEGEEGEAYRGAVTAIAEATGKPS